MEKLISVHQSSELGELFKSMVAFHNDYKAPKKSGTGRVGNRTYNYMLLDDLLATVRPILCKHGLFVMQEITGDGLITTIAHKSGQYRASVVPFSRMDGNKGTNSLQEVGGGLTYFKRYALAALLGISDKDDLDGEDDGAIIKQNKSAKDFDAKRKELLARAGKIKDADMRERAQKYINTCDDKDLKNAENSISNLLNK